MLKLLAVHLLARAVTYGLPEAELARLRAWQEELPAAVEPGIYGGAGESAVVLSPERYGPSEGVLVKPDET